MFLGCLVVVRVVVLIDEFMLRVLVLGELWLCLGWVCLSVGMDGWFLLVCCGMEPDVSMVGQPFIVTDGVEFWVWTFGIGVHIVVIGSFVMVTGTCLPLTVIIGFIVIVILIVGGVSAECLLESS